MSDGLVVSCVYALAAIAPAARRVELERVARHVVDRAHRADSLKEGRPEVLGEHRVQLERVRRRARPARA